MESSIEETASTSQLDCNNILFEEDTNLKASILLNIQNNVDYSSHFDYDFDFFDLKLKYRGILDDMKTVLLHKKYNKILFTTVLRELQSSERQKSKLWDDLTSNL